MKDIFDEEVANDGAASIGRRQFLSGGVAAAAALVAGGASAAGGKKNAATQQPPAKNPGKLISSPPLLQNPAETSMDVAFTVTADASGWVEYATSPDMIGANRAYSGGAGLMTVDDRMAQVRLRGLTPATRYWYRIGADRIAYNGGYKMKNLGPELDETVHSFTTLGAGASGSFCVINDTHEAQPVLDAVFKKLKDLKPALVIWNGDASNVSETFEAGCKVFVRPHPDHLDYSSDTPYALVRGNHDFRGRFNRTLERIVMLREPTERAPEFAELGRNFVQRLGDIALIGLDTGEDKLDTNPRFAGIFRMREYRELQTKWLAEAVKSPAVATARFKVAFCHIPLFDPRPNANPGDVMPDDTDPRYTHDYARWQRTCARMWGPLLNDAGVKLLITGHQHRYRRDNPVPSRPWTQLVGGGPYVDSEHAQACATIIEGRVKEGRLVVRVHNVATGAMIDTLTI